MGDKNYEELHVFFYKKPAYKKPGTRQDNALPSAFVIIAIFFIHVRNWTLIENLIYWCFLLRDRVQRLPEIEENPSLQFRS